MAHGRVPSWHGELRDSCHVPHAHCCDIFNKSVFSLWAPALTKDTETEATMECQQWLQACRSFVEPSVEASEIELGAGAPFPQGESGQVWEEAGHPGKEARHGVSPTPF